MTTTRPPQYERLVILQEECAEVIQAISKIHRHGLEGRYDNGEDNKTALERELGDVWAILTLMVKKQDVDIYRVDAFRKAKVAKLTDPNNPHVYFQKESYT